MAAREQLLLNLMAYNWRNCRVLVQAAQVLMIVIYRNRNFRYIHILYISSVIYNTGRFPRALAYYFHNPSANGKLGPIREEMSQTLPTNKKRRKPGLSTRP
jgi:hypothetical protein